MTWKEDIAQQLRLLTVDDFIGWLRLSRDTVYRLAAAEELPGHMIISTWRFPSNVVKAYIPDGQAHGIDRKNGGGDE